MTAGPKCPSIHSLRRLFAYTDLMPEIGGYNKSPDWVKLGPSLLIASCVILAIRTAKWAARTSGTSSQRDLDVEVENATYLADRVLAHLLAKREGLFPSKQEPWYHVDKEDIAQ